MTFASLINAVAAALAPLASAEGMDVMIAESLEEAQAFLTAAPNRPRIILHWEGFGDHADAGRGMTTHQVATVLQQARGLGHKPGENLTTPLPGGALPFAARIEQLIGWMTAMRFPDGQNVDRNGFALSGSQWLTSAAGTRAHVFNWRLDAAHSGYSATIPLTF